MKKEKPKQYKGGTTTFIVDIKHTRNATWQGTITWAEKKQELNFRSVLELLKLMESAIEMEEASRLE